MVNRSSEFIEGRLRLILGLTSSFQTICQTDRIGINGIGINWIRMVGDTYFTFFQKSLFCMLPSFAPWFTGFRTVIVFAFLPMTVLFFGFNGNFNRKMTKINQMAKNHFSGVQINSQSVKMGVLGGVFVFKSGLRILIWALKVPFSVPPK